MRGTNSVTESITNSISVVFLIVRMFVVKRKKAAYFLLFKNTPQDVNKQTYSVVDLLIQSLVRCL